MKLFKRLTLMYVIILLVMMLIFMSIDILFDKPIEWIENIKLANIVSIFNVLATSLTLKE